jgi:hypothetical protein
MKATIDIPDQLYRRVKARAALEGRAVREVTIELYTEWLGEGGPGSASDVATGMDTWLARWADLGGQVRAASVDDRPVSEIITAERR